MIDITDKNYQPDMEEIGAYIASPLFSALRHRLENEYKALFSVEYSGDKTLPGWNIRFRKAGRTLCRLYPQRGRFTILVVIGPREKERAEALLPHMSDAMGEIYRNTKEGMGQRWRLISLSAQDALFDDALRLIAIRRDSEDRAS